MAAFRLFHRVHGEQPECVDGQRIERSSGSTGCHNEFCLELVLSVWCSGRPENWSRNCLGRVNLDFHIVSKPGVLIGPMERPLHGLAALFRCYVSGVPRVAYGAAGRLLRGLPAIVGPNHIKTPFINNAQRFPGLNPLDGPPAAIDFHIASTLCLPSTITRQYAAGMPDSSSLRFLGSVHVRPPSLLAR